MSRGTASKAPTSPAAAAEEARRTPSSLPEARSKRATRPPAPAAATNASAPAAAAAERPRARPANQRGRPTRAGREQTHATVHGGGHEHAGRVGGGTRAQKLRGDNLLAKLDRLRGTATRGDRARRGRGRDRVVRVVHRDDGSGGGDVGGGDLGAVGASRPRRRKPTPREARGGPRGRRKHPQNRDRDSARGRFPRRWASSPPPRRIRCNPSR